MRVGEGLNNERDVVFSKKGPSPGSQQNVNAFWESTTTHAETETQKHPQATKRGIRRHTLPMINPHTRNNLRHRHPLSTITFETNRDIVVMP